MNLVLLLKGDVPGHEFHGNQWTGGAGSTYAYNKEAKQWEGGTEGDQARLNGMKVPPAWSNVRLNPDVNGDLQVLGIDSKGRTQYLYSAEHSERAAAEKFARLRDFNEKAPSINALARQDMGDETLSRSQRDAAAVTALIASTGFRIGSDDETGAKVKAYGASTLLGSHVSVNGDTMHFEFIGKKGVSISSDLEDKQLASYIRGRQAENGNGRLFATNDAAVRDYFHSKAGDEFKVKDFRTWVGTGTAIQALMSFKPPTTAAEFKKIRAAVAKKVSSVLGNTPTVALQSYIDPYVFSGWGGHFALGKKAQNLFSIMDEFFETHHYDKTPGDWRNVPETASDPDDRVEKIVLSLLTKAKSRPQQTSGTWEYVDAHEGKLAGRLRGMLKRAAKEVVGKVGKRLELGKVILFLTKAKPSHSKEVQDILDQLDLDGISSVMVDELTDEMKDAFKDAGVRAYQQVGFKDTPEIVDHMDQAALDYAGMRGAELVGKRVLADGTVVDNPNAAWSITNTMRDDLRDLVSDAIVEGWSTGDLQDAIQDSFSFSDARAEMIARTELAYAHVAGNMEGWRQSGVVEKKRWVAADADPCPECEALDGEEVGLDEDFSSGDDGPPAHPSCRCNISPVTASVEDIIGAYTGLSPEEYEEEKVDLSLLTKIHHPHKVRYGDKWRVVDDDGKVYGTHDTEEQANRQLAALYANKVDLGLLKGDVEGHEFHGNQWTGGTGSVTDQEIRAGVSSVAKQLGYPEEKITYSTKQQDFKVGGIDYVASGQANRDTGEITLFPNIILDRAEAEGIAAHEIGHCQFEAVKASMGTAAFFDSMEKDWGQLIKDDGVSEYSRDWWDALSKGDANMMQCLHETFAEITRLDYEGKRDGKTLTEQGVKQSWRKLYMRMQKEYQKAKKVDLGLLRKGGSGSGNFGHAGRPGEVGGSASEGSDWERKAEHERKWKELVERSKHWTGNNFFEPTKENKEAKGKQAAEKLGFDVEKLKVSEEDKKFELEGHSYNYAGAADLATGEITIFPKAIASLDDVPGIVAHEVGHQQFEAVTKIYQEESAKVMEDPATSVMRADGSFPPTSGLNEKYPVYAAYQANVNASGVWDRLQKDDGVTNYSKEWWGAWKDGKASTHQAMHETFAEINRLVNEGKWGSKPSEMRMDTYLKSKGVSPTWRRLYNTFQKIYTERKK